MTKLNLYTDLNNISKGVATPKLSILGGVVIFGGFHSKVLRPQQFLFFSVLVWVLTDREQSPSKNGMVISHQNIHRRQYSDSFNIARQTFTMN